MRVGEEHWALIIVHIDEHKITYHDSLRRDVDHEACELMKTHMLEQHDKFDVERLNKPEYTISDEVEAEVQAHPSDCGIHMLKFARSVIDDEWKEKTAHDIRLHILMNIWSGQI